MPRSGATPTSFTSLQTRAHAGDWRTWWWWTTTAYEPLRRREVLPLEARWQTPNTLLVVADTARDGDHLIALVSDFPGWTVAIDGRPARMETVNDYLGVRTEAGSHTYAFEFRPRSFYIGLTISSIAFAIAVVLVIGSLGGEAV